MNIEELLKQIKKVKEAQDADGTQNIDDTKSMVPQKLTCDPKNSLPKNVVAEGEEGDSAKIEALLNAIAEDEVAKGASESLLMAKLAEEVAEQDQNIIQKQAQYFGAVMADAMLNRLSRADQVTEKEASDAADAQAQSWYAAGSIMAEGYLDKLAEVAQEASDGVVNETAVPAVVNQDEEAEIDENALDYIAAEMAQELAAQEEGPDAPKNASEKQAGTFATLRSHIKNILAAAGVKGTAGTADRFRNIAGGKGKAMRTAGTAIGATMTTAGRYTKNNPYVVGGGAMAMGTGYAAGRTHKKESAESVISSYLNGEIDVKSAAAALKPVK